MNSPWQRGSTQILAFRLCPEIAELRDRIVDVLSG